MRTEMSDARHVAVIGAGFGGLAAAWELVRCGVRVTVLEADADVGGLAGSFDVNGERLEKFYHHWFTTDHYVTALVRELGVEDRVVYRQTRTGMYFAQQSYRLSTPSDVLRFTPLSLAGRVRLGLLALRARGVTDWRALESLTAEEWLVQLGGREVYRVVWEPLMRGKFGPYASEISAVWFWNKLKLRGGSRDSRGAEVLAYFRGGFATLAALLRDAVEGHGGAVLTSTPVTALAVERGCVTGVVTPSGTIDVDAVIATPALPIIADLVEAHVPCAYSATLRRIEYLANLCVVLELDRSLSETYWLNVNDPRFPFVGVIEHTNFEPASTYGGRHLVYLSRYLPATDALYTLSDDVVLDYCMPHLQRMFPDFERAWVLHHHVWRARYAQPVVVRRFSDRIPASRTPLRGLFLATMAQVYPEDRGTNYAIREGRRVARTVAEELVAETALATAARGGA